MAQPLKPRRRRFLRVILMLGCLLLIGIAGLPWLASVGPVRALVLGVVNQKYAPTRIELGGASASWVGPVRLSRLVLKDSEGKVVVASPTATLNRSLLDLIRNRSDHGILTLHGAMVNIERGEDGKIDLAEALRPILASEPGDPGDPASDFTLKIEHGTLTLQSPELGEPITTDDLDLTLHAAPEPKPLSWDITLSGTEAAKDASLHVEGTSDAEAAGAPIHVAIEGKGWALSVATSGVEARGRVVGGLRLDIVGDESRIAGDARLLGVTAGGPTLNGDTPTLGDLAASFELTTGKTRFDLATLKLDASFGHIEVAGGDAAQAVGRVDLAALAKLFPQSLHLREGLSVEAGELTVDAKLSEGGQRASLLAELRGLAAKVGDRAIALDAPMVVRGDGHRRDGSITIDRAEIDTPFLKAEGKGSLADGITVTGTADLDALHRQAAQWVELGDVSLSGRTRFGGDLKKDDTAKGFTGRVAMEADELRIAGIGASPIERPNARLDVIVTGPLAEGGLPEAWRTLHLNLRSGHIQGQVELTEAGEATGISATMTGPKAELQTLVGGGPVASRGLLEPPVKVRFDGAYQASADRLEIARASVGSVDGEVEVKGVVGGLRGPLAADLTGTIAPSWRAIEAKISAGAMTPTEVVASPSPFRLKGPLTGPNAAAIVRGLDAELALDLAGAQMLGLTLGATPMHVVVQGGRVTIDPISTTLNSGRVDLKPLVRLGDDGSVVLAIEPGGAIEGAEINEALSRTLLSYVAPVLHGATQIEGRVSARFERLEVPLAGPAAAKGVELKSQIAFQDVTYGPGPLTREVLAMSGVGGVPRLRMDQTVDVDVRDNRVWQSGLSIEAGPDVRVELAGSVGFDTTVALEASVPLTSGMLGRDELANELAGGERIGVPIGGTLARPRLDRAAFQVALRKLSGQVLKRAAGRGAGELLKGLGLDDGPLPAEAAGGESFEEGLKGLGRGLLREIIRPEGGGPR